MVPELQRFNSARSSVSADDIHRLFEDRLSRRSMRGNWKEPSLEPFKHFASKRSRDSARHRTVMVFESVDSDGDEKRKEEGEKYMPKVYLCSVRIDHKMTTLYVMWPLQLS